MRYLGSREPQLCLLRVGCSRARVSKVLSSGKTEKYLFGRAGGAESQQCWQDVENLLPKDAGKWAGQLV